MIIATLLCYYLRLSYHQVGELGFPLDDSWIHVRFAQNLAAGMGFSFNPGVPTSTTTSALWTLVFAGAYRITHEFLITSFLLNGLICVALCVVAGQLAIQLTGKRWLGLAAAVIVAATAPLPWWALSGMEPPLYGLLGVLGVFLHLRLRRAGSLWRAPVTIVFALAGLARPECLLLFPLAILDRAFTARSDHPARIGVAWIKETVCHGLIFTALVIPLFLYNHRVSGYWLPSSFYSKQQWESVAGALAMHSTPMLLYALMVSPLKELGALWMVWAHNNIIFAITFLIGFIISVKQAFRGGKEAHTLLIPLVLILQPAVSAILGGYRPPDFQSQRYLANLNPLFIVLGIIGVWKILERIHPLKPAWVKGMFFGLVLLASLARQPIEAETYILNVKNITDMHVTIGCWLKENTPRGSLLALNDVGAITVITGDPVIDLQGLVTPEILPLRSLSQRVAGTAPWEVSEFIFKHQPDYLVIFPAWYPELDQRRDLFTPVFLIRLEKNITAGSDLMVVYRTVWAEIHAAPKRGEK